MKAIKKTTCLVLALMLVCMTTTAFAGTKYSNPVGLGTVLPRATATPAPTEAPLPTEAPAVEEEEEQPVFTNRFQRDASGNLVLDAEGNPIMMVLDGEALPTGFERDASGNLILDANGDPIPTYAPVETPAPEVTAEPVPEVTAEPIPEVTAEPVPEVTADPIVKDEPIEAAEVIAVGEADVRLNADGLSDIFATLSEGTVLKVLGVEGDWVVVEVEGQIGYVYKDSVSGIEFEQPDIPADADPVEKLKVTIFTSRRTVVNPGEGIRLTSKLEGFEDYTVYYQWQYDRGNGFEDIAGANNGEYSYEASVETLAYDWRLVVSYE